MVRNATVESEKKTKTIKATVQPASGICHPKTFMGIIKLWRNIRRWTQFGRKTRGVKREK